MTRTAGWLGRFRWFPALALAASLVLGHATDLKWIQTSRVFLIDAYQPPFAPKLEYDAEALVKTMVEMHANTVRVGTMGKYATIQGVRFSPYPDLGKRDVLAETIAAAKPRGLRVVPYISTGHKLAWTMVTKDYPEYAQQARPGGGPNRSHMYVGEDHGTVCWMGPYRKAFLDLVEHVVRDYDIDGIYFDSWRAFYFWPKPMVCYCEGCRTGFRQACGQEIPWHEKEKDYTAAEKKALADYHQWYREQIVSLAQQVRRLVKSYKDIPLIYNINDPRRMAAEDPRIPATMDAFLYERGHSLLERAEGVSLARAAGLGVWPYVGVYNNWPRLIPNGLDYQQEIFATVAFGGAPIIAQPYGYVTQPEQRAWVASPFAVLQAHEKELGGCENVPYVAVVRAEQNPPGHAQAGMFWEADVRSSTLGAFAACLYGHLQVCSILDTLLDAPEKLARYRAIYLADIPHLTPQRIANLRQYVENGGGLLVSYATSRYDEHGERLEKFALEDLLHVRPLKAQGEMAEALKSYTCMVGGPNELYLRSRRDPAAPLVPMWYFEPVEVLPGGAVAADIITGDGSRPLLPGVVTSACGKGRVVYLAASLESLYRATRQAVLGQFVRQLAEEAAGAPPPFRVTAPSALVANLATNGDTRILHLLNWTTDPENESSYLPPIENVSVRVTIPEGKRVARVATFIKAPFKEKQTGRELELRFPRIDAYQAVAIELK